jgi:hypothetical protein
MPRLLVAIDDVQWLDSSSKGLVAFAARRLKGRVGIAITERSEPHLGAAASWLQLGPSFCTGFGCAR